MVPPNFSIAFSESTAIQEPAIKNLSQNSTNDYIILQFSHLRNRDDNHTSSGRRIGSQNGSSYRAFSLFSFKQSLTTISSTDLITINYKDYKHRATRDSGGMRLQPQNSGADADGPQLRIAWSITAFWDSQGYRETIYQKEKEKKKQHGLVTHAFLNHSTRGRDRQTKFKSQPGLQSEL